LSQKSLYISFCNIPSGIIIINLIITLIHLTFNCSIHIIHSCPSWCIDLTNFGITISISQISWSIKRFIEFNGVGRIKSFMKNRKSYCGSCRVHLLCISVVHFKDFNDPRISIGILHGTYRNFCTGKTRIDTSNGWPIKPYFEVFSKISLRPRLIHFWGRK